MKKQRKVTKVSKDVPLSQKRLTKCASQKSCHCSKRQHQVYSSPSTIVEKLNSMKAYGKKEVFWSLNSKSKAEIEEAGFALDPHLYLLRTKKFPKKTLDSASSLIKRLHGASMNGKKYISCKPRREEMELIKKYDISYKILKYRIILN